MDEVVIDSIEGRHLRLSERGPADSDGIWSLSATLETEAGQAGTAVSEMGDGLATFFRELADAIGGFDGERAFNSLEGQLTIDCAHDGRGTVTCEVTLAQLSPPTWSYSAQLDLGAGAHLQRVANDIEAFVNVSR
jgi:Family of unknown function (DUF6228)